MTTTHTSGPWAFRGMTRAIVSAPNKDGTYSTIGQISESIMIGEHEHFANAALIAAAPALLAAARLALDYLETLPYQPSAHPSTRAQDALHDAIVAAQGMPV